MYFSWGFGEAMADDVRDCTALVGIVSGGWC